MLAANPPSRTDLTLNPYPAPPSECLPLPFENPLVPAVGDVAVANTWFGPVVAAAGEWRDEEGYASAGNLKTTTTSGADTVISGSSSAATFTREFRWSYGAARWARWSGMTWKLFQDVIDPASGLRAASTGSDGFTTSYQYDQLGRLRQITPGLSITNGAVSTEAPTRITYRFSPPTADMDKGFDTAPPSEHSQEYFLYDTLGRITRHDRRDSDGTIVSQLTKWSAGGLKLSDSTWVDTDQLDERGPLPPVVPETTYSYAWTLPGGATVTDPYNRVHQATYADGATALFDYSGLRETRRVPGINGDPLQVAETKLYSDTLGRLGYVDAPPGSADAGYEYDLRDQMKRANLDGQLRIWSRDALGRLKDETQPESGTTTFPYHAAYDALGNALRRVDADGRVLDSIYDAAGRMLMTSVTEAGQPTQMLTRLTYDEAGHGTYAPSKLTRSEQWSCLAGTCERVMREQFWTGLSGRLATLRLTSEACGIVMDGGLEYDALGLERLRTQPDITATTCPFVKVLYLPEIQTTYAFGLPVALGTPIAPANFIQAMDYAPSQAPKSLLLGNGVLEQTSFDDRLRTSSITVTNGGTTLFETGQYAYDGASNIIGFGPTLERPQAQTFGYDLVGRLTSATLPGVGTFTHVYDPWGNMTSSLLAHGTEAECVPGEFFGWGQFAGREYRRGQDGVLEATTTNRMSTLASTCPRYPGAQVTYDNAGRVTQDDTSLYSWDAQDHLLRRQRLDGGPEERHAYDASGYRSTTETIGQARKVEFRGPDGEIWRSYNAPVGGPITFDRDYVRLGSRLVVVGEGAAAFVWQHGDHLGLEQATRATGIAA